MTIHVNIGEAKTRLSELVAAALRGEEVILQKAGVPQARIEPLESAVQSSRDEIARKRKAAFGMYRDAFAGMDLSPEALKADRVAIDDEDRMRRKFGPAA